MTCTRHKNGVNHLSLPMLLACVLLCSCASLKVKPATPPKAANAKTVKKSWDPASYFPEGVTWENVSPDQVSEAVFAAVVANPDRAAEIAANGFGNAMRTGRFPIAADAKQSVDPEPKWTLFGWLFKKRYLKPKPTTAAMSSEALAEMEFEQVGS
jgi:hypothetical protein